MNLYTVYDKVAEESGPLYEAKNDAVALRMVLKYLADNPDYELFCVGEYNHDIMQLACYQEPIKVSKLSDFIEDASKHDKVVQNVHLEG